jgi:integrase
MAKTVGRLKALGIPRIREPGLYPDGGGLYLQVSGAEANARSWLYRYRHAGRERWMGLGSTSAVSLSEARQKASEARRLKAEGIDPIEARRAAAERVRLAAAKTITFTECASGFLAAHRPAWRRAPGSVQSRHARQWWASLERHVLPEIGALPVGGIDTSLVLKVLEPIWTSRVEMASRVRGRIEVVLDWARVRGHREGDNPARWRGHLDHLLPTRSKVRPVVHHAALPYGELPAFMARLGAEEGVAARALEFTILTAARTNETLRLTWDEIDLARRLWTIPASRMKAGKEHRVPLSNAALAVLDRVSSSSGVVFPGLRTGQPLGPLAMRRVLAEMGRGDLTVHGFRSSFRDWAAERTNFPSEVVEMALAHAVGSKVEAAYRRGDLFDKRRQLMDAWAELLSKVPADIGKVISLRG